MEDFEAVLDLARTGAEEAFASLYRAHQPRLLRYLKASEPQDADDIASQTWLEVTRGLHRFAGGADDFPAWLFTIARRRLLDHRRSRRRRRVVPIAPADLPRLAVAGAEDDAFAGRLGDDAARRIVAELPLELAEILMLRVVAGVSVAEVASITGRSEGAVRVLQHRALRRLARALRHRL